MDDPCMCVYMLLYVYAQTFSVWESEVPVSETAQGMLSSVCPSTRSVRKAQW